MEDDRLTPDEARYAAAVMRAEERSKNVEAAKYHAGHPSRAAFEYSARVYRAIAEKLERQTGITSSAAPGGHPSTPSTADPAPSR